MPASVVCIFAPCAVVGQRNILHSTEAYFKEPLYGYQFHNLIFSIRDFSRPSASPREPAVFPLPIRVHLCSSVVDLLPFGVSGRLRYAFSESKEVCMLTGSCYCGKVRYESAGKILIFANCHCPDCRKFSGSAFSSVLAVEDSGFKVVAGADNLVAFNSSPGKFRSFCKTCGCHLFARAEQRPGMVLLRAGSLDVDPRLKPQSHIWVSMKAPWHDICDSAAQFPEGFPKKPNS